MSENKPTLREQVWGILKSHQFGSIPEVDMEDDELVCIRTQRDQILNFIKEELDGLTLLTYTEEQALEKQGFSKFGSVKTWLTLLFSGKIGVWNIHLIRVLGDEGGATPRQSGRVGNSMFWMRWWLS